MPSDHDQMTAVEQRWCCVSKTPQFALTVRVEPATIASMQRTPLSIVLAVSALTFISACSSRPATDTSTANASADDDWFCEMAVDGDSWDCERDAARVANPNPTRLPQPVSAPAIDDDLPQVARRASPSPETDIPDNAFPEQQATQPAPTIDAQSDAPAYVRLAYRPSEPTPLTALPADFWAVQLIAFESRAALENYVQAKQLRGMSAALIAREGQPFYVLLMGVYETEAIAREAAASLPEQLLDIEPWVRPLAGLQAAMRAAEELATASS